MSNLYHFCITCTTLINPFKGEFSCVLLNFLSEVSDPRIMSSPGSPFVDVPNSKSLDVSVNHRVITENQ